MHEPAGLDQIIEHACSNSTTDLRSWQVGNLAHSIPAQPALSTWPTTGASGTWAVCRRSPPIVLPATLADTSGRAGRCGGVRCCRPEGAVGSTSIRRSPARLRYRGGFEKSPWSFAPKAVSPGVKQMFDYHERRARLSLSGNGLEHLFPADPFRPGLRGPAWPIADPPGSAVSLPLGGR